MTPDEASPPDTTPDRRARLRQLEHDIRSTLGIVTMGLHALEGAREEPDVCAELCRAMAEEGVEPLKRLVAELVDVASEPAAEQG